MGPLPRSVVICILTGAACEGPQRLPDVEQSFTLAGGAFTPGSGDWDGRGAGSLAWSWRGHEWPCALELGALYSAAEVEEGPDSLEVDVFELRVGAADTWRPATWLILVAGAGPRLSHAQAWIPGRFAEVYDYATSIGLYAHGGAFVSFGGSFSAGLDAQVGVGTDFGLAGGDQDAQATGLMLAARWDF
ncbi:MAG: hypothetical protein JNK02_09095 [Planctomycetes bacterium]|nr:hypothetical protein [Planctomycetota bacterium]